jgi:hypothetical protein
MRRSVLAIFFSIIALAVGFAVNFAEWRTNAPANIKNVVGTAVYIVIWIVAYYYAKQYNSKKTQAYFQIIWGLTLVCAIMYLYAIITNNLADWYMFLGIALLGQFYGLGFFLGFKIVYYAAIAAISLAMTLAAV